MAGTRVFRVFISSPSDVFNERERIERVIRRLNGELGGGTTLEAIRWESHYYTADKTFQDQIVQPSQTDLVVCILWKRLGAELPPAYRRPDGTTPTGTEYEFEDAMAASRLKGTPDVLVYRKTAAVLLDAERIDVERAQFAALKTFWGRWFQTEAGHFTAGYDSFETTDQFELKAEDHIRQWLARNKAELSGAVTWSIALKGSPFRGLQPFDETHAEVFFGRRRAVEQIREKLVDAAGRGTPFLLVLSTSGSGKSSVVRAGVVPRVTEIGAVPGVDLWRRCVFRPSEGGGDVLLGLARALYRQDVLPELGDGDSAAPADFAALLGSAPEAAARAVRRALGRVGKALAAREGFDRSVETRLLLVVDQLEEALAAPPDAVEKLARGLGALARDGQTWIVGTLRSDLYAAFQASPALVALRERGALFDLLPPSATEIAEIVRGPATAAGLRFETRPDGSALDDDLIEAATRPGSLPLLQLALDELFAARDPQTQTLRFATRDGFGGLPGVVERRAEETLAGLGAEAVAALPRVLGALVDVSEEGSVTSRPAARAAVSVSPAAAHLVEAFVAARLLIADGSDGNPTLRVAHEALVGGWPRAGALIAADRDALRVRGRVADAARRWLAENRLGDFLLPAGRPLAEASELADHRPEALSAEIRTFVEASRAAEAERQAAAGMLAERELRLEREAADARADAALRVARRTRLAAIVVSLLLVVATASAGLAWFARREVQRRATLAERNFAAALNAAGQLGEGATRVSQGDFRGAVAAYREGQAVVQRIIDRDPEAATYYALKRTDAVLHKALGRTLVLEGENAEGNGELDRSLALFRDALAVAPPEAEAEDDLLSTEDTVAAALFLEGDRSGAVKHLRDGVALADPVVAAAPGRVGLAYGLGGVELRLGDFLEQAGDHPGALAAYGSARRLAERFRAAHAEDPRWIERVAEAERGEGVALMKTGDAPASLARFEAAMAVSREATTARPDEAEWQRVAISLDESLAAGLEAKSDFAPALDHATAALARAEALSARDPANATWRFDTAIAHSYVGVALKLLGRGDEAKDHFDRMQALMKTANR